MTKPKPFYEFVGRERGPIDQATGWRLTDRLIWQNRADPTDRITGSEWWFWRLWRYNPGSSAHPLAEPGLRFGEPRSPVI
jgi:hypothetical protein